ERRPDIRVCSLDNDKCSVENGRSGLNRQKQSKHSPLPMKPADCCPALLECSTASPKIGQTRGFSRSTAGKTCRILRLALDKGKCSHLRQTYARTCTFSVKVMGWHAIPKIRTQHYCTRTI